MNEALWGISQSFAIILILTLKLIVADIKQY